MNSFDKYRIILASQSPRRREIMTMAGFKFEVLPAEGEEKQSALPPDELTMALSKAKAEEVFKRESERNAECGCCDDTRTAAGTQQKETFLSGADRPLLVIGADTVVAYDGQILGKPKDLDDAYRMLKLLSGNTHQVYTGVTMIIETAGCPERVTGTSACRSMKAGSGESVGDAGADSKEEMRSAGADGKEDIRSADADSKEDICSADADSKEDMPGAGFRQLTFFEKTDVTFHELTDEEILQYIHTEEPLDKAGSYAIQGAFGKYIRKIDGDYYNVVGLPIQRIWQELSKM